MTVTYTDKVADANFAVFIKLLGKWRGSVYKLIWAELIAFLLVYYALHVLYRFALNEQQQKYFELLVKYCSYSVSLIPHTFVLGFYVKIVMERWWKQYQSIPWPDPLAVLVSSVIRGQEERVRLMRRTIMRYVCLSLTMVFAMISPVVKKRLPTLEAMRDIGLIQDNELEIMNHVNEMFPKHRKHWIPIVWASSIIIRARKESLIRDDSALQTLMGSLNDFRGMATRLTHYDAISIPLVYTQVAALAVYSYFICNALAQQWVRKKGEDNQIEAAFFYIPMFTVLEFFFFMGWLKVAEALICPFGEDDDDFNVDSLIDRNLAVSYVIVDEMNNAHPQLLEDNYWNHIFHQQHYLRLLPSRTFSVNSESGTGSNASEGTLRYKKFLNDLNNIVLSIIWRQGEPSEHDVKTLFRSAHWSDKTESEREAEAMLSDSDIEEYDEVISVNILDSGDELIDEEGDEGYEPDDYLSSGIDHFEMLRQQRMSERQVRARQRVRRALESIDLPPNVDIEAVISQILFLLDVESVV